MCSFLFLGCCRFRVIWRKVCTLPTSEDVCQQQQQPPENFYTLVNSESKAGFSFYFLSSCVGQPPWHIQKAQISTKIL